MTSRARVRRQSLSIFVGLSFLLAACAGPEDPGAAIAAQTAPPPTPSASATPDGMATTGDGKLDLEPIAGTWRGQAAGEVFGQNSGGGSDWIELRIEPEAEKFWSAGIHAQGTTANEPICEGKMIALSATPPVYAFRLLFEDASNCRRGRIQVVHDPGTDTLQYTQEIGNLTLEGPLNRVDNP